MKETAVKIKKLTTDWVKIFTKYIFLSTIYKELLYINNNKKYKPTLKWAKQTQNGQTT